MKDIPALYNRKEECCGCTACYAFCPKSAISMVEDEEGFDYPQIDESKCVRCYQCIKVFPIKATKENSCKPKESGVRKRRRVAPWVKKRTKFLQNLSIVHKSTW